MQKIKVNDIVVVISGKDKGKTGKVVKIDKKNNKVLATGLSVAKKALRPTKENPNGGIVDKESFIDISNVALISPKHNKPTRVRFEIQSGKKVRIATLCKTVI